MDGVGKTRVMLTFSDEGTDQLDKNVTKDGNKKEETTVVYDTGDTRQPYVICRQMPKLKGLWLWHRVEEMQRPLQKFPTR